jgi:acetyltransferase-like isoleucine patch superfamily enzyme
MHDTPTPRLTQDAGGEPIPPRFHAIVPGATLPGDWARGSIPTNVIAGPGCVIDSTFCFKHFFSTLPGALRLGSHVTLWRTALSTEAEGTIVIGDHSWIANASLVAVRQISIGARVVIAGGATVVDSDFHPLDPAARLADTIALSPRGDRARRPTFEARPVIIEDDVWIGWNATILKGLRIGAGAVIHPGAVVTRDVAPGAHVHGNPATSLEP